MFDTKTDDNPFLSSILSNLRFSFAFKVHENKMRISITLNILDKTLVIKNVFSKIKNYSIQYLYPS
jgi:hypothetical protein